MNIVHRTLPCALLALAACTTPADVSRPLTAAGADKNAKFTLHDTADGFTVEVRYSRYQFVPEQSALLTACRSLVTARAYDEAKARGREIEPINDQAVRVSTGRNIVNARSACRAFAEATGRSLRWTRSPASTPSPTVHVATSGCPWQS